MKRSTKLLLPLLFLLASCGKEPQALNNYISQFEQNTGFDAAEIKIEIVELTGSTIGVCWSNGLIQIDSRYWSRASEAEREILMWHELGHCVAKLSHVKGRLLDGCPASIMSPEAPSADCSLDHVQAYKQNFLAATMALRASAELEDEPGRAHDDQAGAPKPYAVCGNHHE